MKLKLLLTILAISLISPGNAYAYGDPNTVLFEISNHIIGFISEFTYDLYSGVAAVYKRVFLLICLISFPLISYAYLQGKIGLESIISFVLSLNIISAITFNVDTFLAVVYEPFFSGVYRFASFIANTSADIEYRGGNGVKEMFTGIYGSVDDLSGEIDEVSAREGLSPITDFKTSILLTVFIFIIKMIFFVLCAIFTAFFTLTIVRAHMIMIVMPVTLSLLPFQSMRAYGFNHLKLLLREGLTVIFYIISISISIKLVGELQNTANGLEEAKHILDFSFLVAAITTPLIGIILMFSSAGLAASILNVVGGGNVMSGRAITKAAGLAVAGRALGARGVGFVSKKSSGAMNNNWNNLAKMGQGSSPISQRSMASSLGLRNYSRGSNNSGYGSNFDKKATT